MLDLEPSDRTISVGSAKLRVLPPARLDETQNNNSVGILLEYETFKALFSGDAEAAQLDRWVQAGKVPQVNVLKASHHGASNGVTDAWISATKPNHVVVSVSGTNSYGHPSVAAIQTWQRAGANVWRTDIEGSVTIAVQRDGTYQVLSSRRSSSSVPLPR